MSSGSFDKVKTGIKILGKVVRIDDDDPNVKQADSELGKTALTVTRTINNALMLLAEVNFSFDKARKYFSENFESDLSKKAEKIPLESSIFKKNPQAASTQQWPFDQGRSVAALSTKQVMQDGLPVLHVQYYADDGSWAFTCGTTDDESDCMLVSMESVVSKDSTLFSVADLPLGWCAWRASPGASWQRAAADES
ncbi:MAG TPA: hypothetical protein VEY92_00665 [Pseudoxanthomonas sp.]|nr:hypothetical protein [Pseudoxanthomonas sp.]